MKTVVFALALLASISQGLAFPDGQGLEPPSAEPPTSGPAPSDPGEGAAGDDDNDHGGNDELPWIFPTE